MKKKSETKYEKRAINNKKRKQKTNMTYKELKAIVKHG